MSMQSTTQATELSKAPNADSRPRTILMRDSLWRLLSEAAAKSGVSTGRYMRDLAIEALKRDGFVS